MEVAPGGAHDDDLFHAALSFLFSKKLLRHKNQKIFNCPKKKHKYSPIRLLNQYKEGPRSAGRRSRSSLGVSPAVGRDLARRARSLRLRAVRSQEWGHVPEVRVPILDPCPLRPPTRLLWATPLRDVIDLDRLYHSPNLID